MQNLYSVWKSVQWVGGAPRTQTGGLIAKMQSCVAVLASHLDVRLQGPSQLGAWGPGIVDRSRGLFSSCQHMLATTFIWAGCCFRKFY